MHTDPTGNFPLQEWIALALDVIADRVQEVNEEKEKAEDLTFENNSSGGVKIRNSFTTNGLYEIAEYSYTLVNESEYADYFQGNYEGVFVEWALHNAACYIPGVDLDRAKHVDLGQTIFDDQNEWFRLAMWGVYSWLFPEQYQEDLNTYLDRIGGKK